MAEVDKMYVAGAADGRSDLQLRRTGLSGVRDVEVPGRHPREERVPGRGERLAGIPTSFMATWGSGKPVIALGSDIDGIPQASQKPGVAYHDPMIEGAPGHGEGHNSGKVVNITAAIVLKKIMEREKIPGTIRIWPGVAEELLGTKAYYVRAGLVQGRRRRALHARRQQPRRLVGRRRRHRTGLGAVQLQGRSRRTPPARRGAAGARSTPSS